MHNCTLIGLLILILILCFYYKSMEPFTKRVPVCNKLDNRCYPIVDKFDYSTHQEASNLLAYLNEYAITLMRHMRKKYLWNKQGTIYQQNMIKFLLENYNPDSIIENNPKDENFTSYVEDKGKVFAICLREKKSGKHYFHDKNILEFVVMHEMAHMSTPEIGHDIPEFWINFKLLITEATKIGIHNPINYTIYPINYCKLNVDYNPYFDEQVSLT